jgi:undecaprenyl-diphosphatase
MDIIYIIGAKYLFIVPIFLFVFVYIKASKFQKRDLLIFSLPSFALTLLIGKILNRFIYTSRPFISEGFSPLIEHAPDNGFPSDHTLLVASIAMIISFYNRKLGTFLWILTILVGISRILVGVHHLTDILGSILIAIFSTTTIYWLLKKRKML